MITKLPDESNTIEYKEKLPEDSIKWLKTVVSFSNTSGGEIIIGVEDETKKPVGLSDSRSKLESRLMDTIYNGVSPIPVVDLKVVNYKGFDLMVLDVAQGNETPYFIKSESIENGTYVRFGSTDRVATKSQIEELKLMSKRLNFSNLIYKDHDSESYEISEQELDNFIQNINKINIQKEITKSKLIEWELITHKFEKYYATNGYMLLTNNPFYYAYIKIGIFDGTTKSKLLDEEIVEGSIINQYNESIDKIVSYLHEGYRFQKIRTPEYSIPKEVIREIMANAIIHRTYSEKNPHPIRVEIYEDRISVFSPGALYDGLQVHEMLEGISKLRNTNIAEIFHSLGYIERWGSGIQRANASLKENFLNPLEIDAESIHGITITIRFEKMIEFEKTIEDVIGLEETIIQYYRNNGMKFTRQDVERQFDITIHQARTAIEKLLKEVKIEKRGSGRSTYYVVK